MATVIHALQRCLLDEPVEKSTYAPGIVWATRLQQASSSDDDERAFATMA
jgi:hypothetical protein